MSAFLITFRESLEAGVIVGLLMSILASFQAHRHQWYIWSGVLAGIVCSVLFYFGFTYIGNGFEGKSEKIYEGILMLGAAGLITHMTFWMRRQSRSIKDRMKEKIEYHIANKTLWMISVIAFASVVREGVETVIFFSALEVQSGGLSQVIYAIIGILAAIILSIMIYSSTRRVDIGKFFYYTGLLLLLVSAGLLAHGIVELQGANIIPTFIKPLYDITPILSESEGIGSFLKALFGYDGNPSLTAVIAYILFIVVTLWAYQRKA